MSSLSYREWEIWKNSTYFESENIYTGYYECVIMPTAMAEQTIEFLIEQYEIRDFNFLKVDSFPPQYNRQLMYNHENALHLKIYTSITTTEDLSNTIKKITKFLNTLSVSVDFPLICHKIRFIEHNKGKLLVVNRKAIGRGVSFEVEERGIARTKIDSDFQEYLDNDDIHFQAGLKHYLTGMQLLSLEDQVTGLIDAAFMQFYQGCEVLCRDEKGRLPQSKKYIKDTNFSNSRDLQIIAHQVWKVRHKYYGHGDSNFNIKANQDISSIKQVANQVLVARYLCRSLLDSYVSSKTIFTREIGLFADDYSGNFNGQIDSLKEGNKFYVDFGENRKCEIFNNQDESVEEYII